jgi:uncharacterized membrane protein YdjX (TVP38/TMEM64 family)
MKTNLLRSRRFWLLVLGGILIVVLGSKLPLQDWFTQIKHQLALLGWWAMPAFTILYLLVTLLCLPNIILILVSGSLFGLFKGIVLVSIADTLAAVACFLLGRTVLRQRIKKWISKNPSFVRLDQAVGNQGWKILLLTRLSPLVPSNLLNYGFSCTKVNFWQYCFFSWLGMLPIIALYTYLGSFGVRLLNEGLTPGKVALQLVGALLAIGAGVYTTRIAKKALTINN